MDYNKLALEIWINLMLLDGLILETKPISLIEHFSTVLINDVPFLEVSP